MASAWYCQIAGKRYGPLRSSQLSALARVGDLLPDDLVRQGTEGRWSPAGNVRGLEFPDRDSTAAAERLWYCRIGGSAYGPLSARQLKRLADVGRLSASDLVRNSLRARWLPAAKFRGLLPKAERPPALRPQLAADGGPDAPRPPALEPNAARGRMRAATAALIALGIVPFVLPRFGPPIGGVAICLLAIVGVALGVVVYRALCRPDRASAAWATFALIFSGIFGAATLLQFADFAAMMADRHVPWQHAPLLLVKAVGQAYQQAMSPGVAPATLSGFLLTLLSTALSVGLFEETIKLIPAAVAVGTGHIARRRGAMFIGAMAGLGFGVAEGLWVAFDAYLPHGMPLSSYLTRFLGCVFGHAAITLVAASFLLAEKTPREKSAQLSRPRFFGVLALCVGGAAIVHGFYDACLSHGMASLAGLTMSIVVWAVVVLNDDGPPA